MEKSDRTSFWLLVLLVVSVCLNFFQWHHGKCGNGEVKTDTVEVVRWDTIPDSLPEIKEEKVIGQVTFPFLSNSLKAGKKHVKETGFSLHDTIDIERKGENFNMSFDMVQKEYSDDSTYTAYVSGLKYGDYPKLDSVIVRQKITERTITNTIYREKKGFKIKLRPAVGGGYDPINRNWGVMIGGAVVLDW